jgi:hypothetical protein
MPPLVTEQHTGAWSTPALCWARQESGVLIGTCGQRLFHPHPQPHERYDQKNDGFIALKLIPAGYPAHQSGTGRPERQPALPYTSLQTALRLHPCRALSSAEAGRSIGQTEAPRNRAHRHNRSVNFGASAPEARPQKTGPARPSGNGRRSGSRLQIEWIAPGLTAESFWTVRRRLIAALEGPVRSGSRQALPDPIESK